MSIEMTTEIMGFIMSQDIVVRMDDGHRVSSRDLELHSGI